MRALQPITISGADLDVALVPDGISAAWTPGSVRVANQSRFALQCTIGADLHWLEPWMSDVWPVRASTSMHVHPVKADPLVPGQTSGSIFVIVAEVFETIPGTYPAPVGAAIISDTLLQAPIVSLTNSTSQNGTAQVPAGTESLSMVLVPAPGTGACFLRLVGHSSGLLLGMAIATSKQPSRVVAAIDSSVDTQVDWTLTVNLGSSNATVTPLPDPAPAPMVPGAPAGGVMFPIHPNANVVAGTPQIVWTVTHDLVNPLALAIFGWSLSTYSQTGNNCTASLQCTNAAIFESPSSNSAELWNRRMVNGAGAVVDQGVSDAVFVPPLVIAAQDPTTEDLSLEFTAPVAATSYGVGGLLSLGVVPWVPGLGNPIA